MKRIVMRLYNRKTIVVLHTTCITEITWLIELLMTYNLIVHAIIAVNYIDLIFFHHNTPVFSYFLIKWLNEVYMMMMMMSTSWLFKKKKKTWWIPHCWYTNLIWYYKTQKIYAHIMQTHINANVWHEDFEFKNHFERRKNRGNRASLEAVHQRRRRTTFFNPLVFL